MRAYSADLRERVAASCDARDGTRDQVAARFCVGSIRRLLRRRRDTGSIKPGPHGRRRAPASDAPGPAGLRQAVRADDDATLQELAQAAGVACSGAAVCGASASRGITRKESRGGRPSSSATT